MFAQTFPFLFSENLAYRILSRILHKVIMAVTHHIFDAKVDRAVEILDGTVQRPNSGARIPFYLYFATTVF